MSIPTKYLQWVYGAITILSLLVLFALWRGGGQIADVGQMSKDVEATKAQTAINAAKIDDFNKQLEMVNLLHMEVRRAQENESECKTALAECQKARYKK